MKLVRIDWIDCTGMHGGGWNHKKDVKSLTPDKIKSVGWVVKKTKKYITIAAHVACDVYEGELCVPRSAILKVKAL